VVRGAGGASPLLARLLASAGTCARETETPLSRESLAATAIEERPGLVGDYLRRRAAEVLGLPSTRLDPAVSLSRLGLDSMMAVTLKNRVEIDLGAAVPVVYFLEEGSLADLAGRVLERFSPPPAPSPSPSASTALRADLSGEEALDLLARLDQISDQEVDALLRSM